MESNHIISSVGMFFLGIVSRSIGGGVSHVFKEACLPFLAQTINKQLSLSGEWNIEHIDEPLDGEVFELQWVIKIKLKQLGQAVSGTACAVCISEGSPKNQVDYEVVGKFSNGVLTASFYADGSKSLNRSTFLLHQAEGGLTLEGYRLFYGRRRSDVRAIRCRWVQSNLVETRKGCGAE
jgi:hypothetical protein